MSSFATGFLQAFGEKEQEKNLLELQSEANRRKSLADTLLKMSQDEGKRPEHRREYVRQYQILIQTPLTKKPPKDIGQLAIDLPLKEGESLTKAKPQKGGELEFPTELPPPPDQSEISGIQSTARMPYAPAEIPEPPPPQGPMLSPEEIGQNKAAEAEPQLQARARAMAQAPMQVVAELATRLKEADPNLTEEEALVQAARIRSGGRSTQATPRPFNKVQLDDGNTDYAQEVPVGDGTSKLINTRGEDITTRVVGKMGTISSQTKQVWVNRNNKPVRMSTDSQGRLIPGSEIAGAIPPSYLIPKVRKLSSGQSIDDAGNITTFSTSTTAPVLTPPPGVSESTVTPTPTSSASPTTPRAASSSVAGSVEGGPRVSKAIVAMAEAWSKRGVAPPKALQPKVQAYMRTQGMPENRPMSAATQTMVEAAPTVLGFVDEILGQLDENKNKLGPLMGRIKGKLVLDWGLEDPSFMGLADNIALLQTLISRMHVGSRGGIQMIQHFKNLMNVRGQHYSNLVQAMNVMKEYSERLMTTGDDDPGKLLYKMKAIGSTSGKSVKVDTSFPKESIETITQAQILEIAKRRGLSETTVRQNAIDQGLKVID